MEQYKFLHLHGMAMRPTLARHLAQRLEPEERLLRGALFVIPDDLSGDCCLSLFRTSAAFVLCVFAVFAIFSVVGSNSDLGGEEEVRKLSACKMRSCRERLDCIALFGSSL